MADSWIGYDNLPRGLRNNNPGNIKTGITWQGMVSVDGPFIVFQDMSWGLRALATDLANKINRGLGTISKIVTEYAPPSENDTAAYIRAVAEDTGFFADQVLPMNQDTLHRMVRGIANHELGKSYSITYITDADIDEGIAMMNDRLRTLFQAVGVAARSLVQAPDGAVKWENVFFLAGFAGMAIYLFTRKR